MTEPLPLPRIFRLILGSGIVEPSAQTRSNGAQNLTEEPLRILPHSPTNGRTQGSGSRWRPRTHQDPLRCSGFGTRPAASRESGHLSLVDLKSLLPDFDEETRRAASQLFTQHGRSAFGKQNPHDLPHQSAALNRVILDSPKSTELLSQELEKANASKAALERVYSALRGSINRLSRPYLRKLTLIDLPNEILLDICSHLDSHSTPFTARPYSAWHASADIKALRLVCRQLSDHASHLLVRVVHLDLHSDASLKRMEEISRHPTISKGVHVISANLVFYNASFTELEHFLSYYAEDSKTKINMYDEFRLWAIDEVPEEVAARFISQGKELAATLRRLSLGEPSDEDERHASHVGVTHQKYLELLQQQDSLLQSDSFYRAVGSAIARMPCARSFVFHDNPLHTRGFSKPLMIPGEDVWENLRRMLVPLSQYRVEIGLLEPPSIRCIIRLIDAVRVAGAASLHHLDINLSSLGRSKDLVPAPDSPSLFSSGMQQLRTFAFRYEYSGGLEKKGKNPAEGVEDMVEFLSACLDTSSLRGLHLDLRRLRGRYPTKTVRLKDIFNRKRRLDNLTEVFLGNFDCDYIGLISFLRRLPTPIHRLGLRSIGLISGNGSWREVLDALREKEPIIAHLHHPAGAECRHMTVEQYNALWATEIKLRRILQDFWGATTPYHGSCKTTPLPSIEGG